MRTEEAWARWVNTTAMPSEHESLQCGETKFGKQLAWFVRSKSHPLNERMRSVRIICRNWTAEPESQARRAEQVLAKKRARSLPTQRQRSSMSMVAQGDMKPFSWVSMPEASCQAPEHSQWLDAEVLSRGLAAGAGRGASAAAVRGKRTPFRSRCVLESGDLSKSVTPGASNCAAGYAAMICCRRRPRFAPQPAVTYG